MGLLGCCCFALVITFVYCQCCSRFLCLEGTIPVEQIQLPNLRNINLERNGFTGETPNPESKGMDIRWVPYSLMMPVVYIQMWPSLHICDHLCVDVGLPSIYTVCLRQSLQFSTLSRRCLLSHTLSIFDLRLYQWSVRWWNSRLKSFTRWLMVMMRPAG